MSDDEEDAPPDELQYIDAADLRAARLAALAGGGSGVGVKTGGLFTPPANPTPALRPKPRSTAGAVDNADVMSQNAAPRQQNNNTQGLQQGMPSFEEFLRMQMGRDLGSFLGMGGGGGGRARFQTNRRTPQRNTFAPREMVYSGGGHRLGDATVGDASAGGEKEGAETNEVSLDDLGDDDGGDSDDDDDDVIGDEVESPGGRELPAAPPIRSVLEADLVGISDPCSVCFDDLTLERGNIVLGCQCIMHFSCLCGLIRATTSSEMRRIKGVAKCPQSLTNKCKYKEKHGREYSISPDELNSLVVLLYATSKDLADNTADGASSPSTPSAEYGPMPIEPLKPEDVEKYKGWLKPATFATKMECDETEDLINASGKKCPNPDCGLISTHFHGHACHHVTGCPSCSKEYCYKCLQLGEVNEKKRGDKKKCLCTLDKKDPTSSWTSWCSKTDIHKFLVTEPYPFDTRCGCVICPDCAKGNPCTMCNGDCVVCLGTVMPAPKELSHNNWDATRDKALVREKMKKRLLVAAQKGNSKQVKNLMLANDMDINFANENGDTALILAAYANHKRVVEILIRDRSTNVNKQNFNGFNALMAATMAGNDEIVQTLMRRPDLDFNCQNHEGQTMLGVAVHNEFWQLAEFFVNLDLKDFDLNKTTLLGDTVINLTCRKGNLVFLHILLSKGVDCRLANNAGVTPLLSAVKGGYIECVRAIVNKLSDSDISCSTKVGQTALGLALDRRRTAIAEILFQRYPNLPNFVERWSGDSALILCTRFGSAKLFEFVLSQTRSKLNVPNASGDTSLIIACKNGYNTIIDSIIKQCNPIELSEVINHCDKDGVSGLLWSIRNSHTECVKALIRQDKCDFLTWQDPKNKNTVLMAAAIGGNVDVVSAIVDKAKETQASNQYINKKNINDYTVLHHAAGAGATRSNVVSFILKNCPCLDYNAQNKDNMTALMIAAQRGFKDTVESLLEHRTSDGKYAIDIKKFDNTPNKRTALMLAEASGRIDIVQLLKKRAATDQDSKTNVAPLQKIDDVIPSIIEYIFDQGDIEAVELKSTFELIIKILTNIEKDFDNVKYRELKKSNKTILSKLVEQVNVVAILTAVGFLDNKDSFELPFGIDQSRLTFVRTYLTNIVASKF